MGDKDQLEQRIAQFRDALSSQGKYRNWECIKGMIYRVMVMYNCTLLYLTPKDDEIRECFEIHRGQKIVYSTWNKNSINEKVIRIKLNSEQRKILKPLREYIKWLAVA